METTARIGILMFAGVAIATAGVLLLPTACTVLTNDALPDDAGPFEGGDADAGEASCASCIVQQCNGVEAVCLLDSTCRGLSCGTSCPCGSAADGGVDPYGAYVAFHSCDQAKAHASCSSECGPPPPGEGTGAVACITSDAGTTDDAGDVDAGDDAGDASAEAAAPVTVTVDGCASCVSGRCGDPRKACAIGTECESFLSCARLCNSATDATCIDTCGTTFASGKEAARELADCTFTACKADCGL